MTHLISNTDCVCCFTGGYINMIYVPFRVQVQGQIRFTPTISFSSCGGMQGFQAAMNPLYQPGKPDEGQRNVVIKPFFAFFVLFLF